MKKFVLKENFLRFRNFILCNSDNNVSSLGENEVRLINKEMSKKAITFAVQYWPPGAREANLMIKNGFRRSRS